MRLIAEAEDFIALTRNFIMEMLRAIGETDRTRNWIVHVFDPDLNPDLLPLSGSAKEALTISPSNPDASAQ